MNDLYPVLAHLIAELKAERDRVQLLYDISRRLTGDQELPQALRSILSLSVPGVAGPEGGASGRVARPFAAAGEAARTSAAKAQTAG